MAISSLFPSSRPSLSLDFAKSRRLDPRIAFSRTHTGNIASYTDSNGLIRFAGPDEPRFDHDPATGESLGLLVEESRTNNALYSDDFNNAAWFKQNGHGLTSNTTIAPDGTQTADTFNRGASNQYIFQSIGITGTHTLSVWVKTPSGAGNLNFVMQHYNTTNGGLGATTFTATEEWQRFSIQASPTVGGGWYPCIPTTLSQDYHVWGAQVEAGFFPTSYIPTSGSAVTRPDDIVSIRNLQDADWWDPQVDSFSMAIEWDSPITLDPATHGSVIGYLSLWSDSTNFNNRIGIPLPHTNSTTAITRAFGAGGAIFNNGTFTASSQDEFKKMAFRYSIPDYSNHTTKVWKIYYNSGDTSYTVTGNVNGTTVPDINRLGIGNNPTRFDESPGIKTFKKLSIYNTVLPDSQLQALIS